MGSWLRDFDNIVSLPPCPIEQKREREAEKWHLGHRMRQAHEATEVLLARKIVTQKRRHRDSGKVNQDAMWLNSDRRSKVSRWILHTRCNILRSWVIIHNDFLNLKDSIAFGWSSAPIRVSRSGLCQPGCHMSFDMKDDLRPVIPEPPTISGIRNIRSYRALMYVVYIERSGHTRDPNELIIVYTGGWVPRRRTGKLGSITADCCRLIRVKHCTVVVCLHVGIRPCRAEPFNVGLLIVSFVVEHACGDRKCNVFHTSAGSWQMAHHYRPQVHSLEWRKFPRWLKKR